MGLWHLSVLSFEMRPRITIWGCVRLSVGWSVGRSVGLSVTSFLSSVNFTRNHCITHPILILRHHQTGRIIVPTGTCCLLVFCWGSEMSCQSWRKRLLTIEASDGRKEVLWWEKEDLVKGVLGGFWSGWFSFDDVIKNVFQTENHTIMAEMR